VQGAGRSAEEKTSADRRLVDAFLAASRQGDLAGLLAILDPEVVFRADDTAAKLGSIREVRGAEVVAGFFKGRAQVATTVLIDGAVGARVAPGGQLLLVLRPTIVNGRIVAIDAVADPDRLAGLVIDELPA
jgi:RNA polymerase sigma-70 factor (ECF subfamily)